MILDAVVLAGGRASRLGGIDKTGLGPPGDTLLDRALRAAAPARRRVVVAGPDDRRPVGGALRTTESPRYGGPGAALRAGLALLPGSAGAVLTIAADLPAVERAVPALLAAVDEASAVDGWMAVDPDGRDQPLLAVYRAGPLRAAVAALPDGGAGAPLRRVTEVLDLARIPLAADLVTDVDTPEDAERAGLPLCG
ncbi:MAG: molybdenum cofactor guanylyltransferase [Amnibacterium sp.]